VQWAVPHSWASALTVGYHSSLCVYSHSKRKEKRKDTLAIHQHLSVFSVKRNSNFQGSRKVLTLDKIKQSMISYVIWIFWQLMALTSIFSDVFAAQVQKLLFPSYHQSAY